MTRIWQVEFISFSGSSTVAYDTVGTQHLVGPSNIVKTAPIGNFVTRSGVSFVRQGTVQYYDLNAAPAQTNAQFCASYTLRSYCMWIYLANINNSTYYWNTATGPVWNSASAATSIENGFGLYFLNGLLSISLYLNAASLCNTAIMAPGWHLAVVTINKSIPESKFYVDGVLVWTGSTIPPNSNTTHRLGDGNATTEESFQLGLLSTYDHILNQSEVTAMYNDFLRDNLVGEIPYQTVSGIIYGTDGLPASGMKMYLLRHDISALVDFYTTIGDGYYALSIPASGNYTVIASNPPNTGGRAIPLNATVSGVYFY